jgi:hypothetical protein
VEVLRAASAGLEEILREPGGMTIPLLDGGFRNIIIPSALPTCPSGDNHRTSEPLRFPKTMNFRLFTGLAAVTCLLMASCHPYNENQQKKKANKGPEKTVTPAEQQKAREEAAKKKAEEDLKKKNEEAAQGTQPGNEGTTTPPTGGGETRPPEEEKRTDYPVASKVPGQEGYVLSPYNQKKISVRDEQDRLIPSGTLVRDPTYPPSEKKYFRVP